MIEPKINKKYREISLTGLTTVILILTILMLIYSLSTIPTVKALSITPSRVNLNYEDFNYYQGTIKVINDEKHKIKFKINVDGPLSSYVILKDKEIIFNENETEKTVDYELYIPSAVNLKPGINEARIIFSAEKQYITRNVMIAPSIVAQVRVHVPYPDKYIEDSTSIFIKDNNIKLTTVLFNRGKAISRTQVTARIKKNSNIVKEIKSEVFSLKEKENKEITLNASLPKGDYDLDVAVTYDNYINKFNTAFTIGEKKVEIISIGIDEIRNNNILKLLININNTWPEKIKNVKVSGYIEENNKTIKIIESYPVKLDVFESKTITVYWNTRHFRNNNYTITFKTNYNDEKEYIIELKKIKENKNVINKAKVDNINVKEQNNTAKIILISIVIIIITVTVIIIKNKNLKNKNSEKNKTRKEDDEFDII